VAGNVVTTTTGSLYVSPDFIVTKATPAQEKRETKLNADQAFQRIAAAAQVYLNEIQANIDKARKESGLFFKLVLIFASVGFVMFLVGVGMAYFNLLAAGTLATIAALISEVSAGLFFKKDHDLRAVIETYHRDMLSSQRVLTMIDLAETIENPAERDRVKQEIIINSLPVKS